MPHTEVDLILVDGDSVGFEHHLTGGERVTIYPMFEGLDISPITRLRPRPLRRPRFIVDANLGRLAGLLRLLGFDSRYEQGMDDAEIARTSAGNQLTILTRDRGLLMRRIVTRGYFVRSQVPREQAAEVIRRFDLIREVGSVARCVECNGVIKSVARSGIYDRLPHKTRLSHDTFFRCSGCSKLYWRGSHWRGIRELIDEIGSAAREDNC